MQKVRNPITLNDFVPKKLKGEELVYMPCYTIDSEKDIYKVAFKASHSRVIEINFSDEDLLLGSTRHN